MEGTGIEQCSKPPVSTQKPATPQAEQGRFVSPSCILSKKVDYRELGVRVEGGKVNQVEVKVVNPQMVP